MAKTRKNAAKQKDAPRGRFHSELFDWGEALLISLTVVILIFVFWCFMLCGITRLEWVLKNKWWMVCKELVRERKR